ncbi:MAG: molecular chaperone TorD family protein [Desulfurococcales archaeon]|nr:molecular chaperone TorD family protein [Desulfurococcales archaeon]
MTNPEIVKLITQIVSITLTSPRYPEWKNKLTSLVDSLLNTPLMECKNIQEILRKMKIAAETSDEIDLEKEYTRLFINALEGVQCPPYESVYKSPRRLMYHEPVIKDLNRYLKLAGVDLDKDRAVSPDHLGALIELFYLLYTYGYIREAEKLYNDHIRFLLGKIGVCLQDKSQLEFYRLVGELFEILGYCIPSVSGL